MKVVDAFWEKRNLGVAAVSFHIGAEDTLNEVLPIIKTNKTAYQTAIVDPSRSEIMLELQINGFTFIECSLSLEASADGIDVPKTLRRFLPQMSYRPATDVEIQSIKSAVESGELFTTDKISLDPFFGVKKAGIRYSFWIDDLIKTGKTVYAITFKDTVIAFEIAGFSEGTVEYYLGGMLPSVYSRMMGALISAPGNVYWKEQGASLFRTSVSSNNMAILKIHQSYGFKIVKCKYVLVKHV